jgi:hypothetical protein
MVAFRSATALTLGFSFFLCLAFNLGAQSEFCEEGADRQFAACLHELGAYTAWMVVPSTDNALPGDLQKAIDEVYTSVQEEWTGPLRAQVHVKWMYVYVPASILLYALLVAFVTWRFRPIIRTTGPRWTIEKATIIGGAAVLSILLVCERIVAYDRMNAQYEMIPRAITHLVHLNPPEQLANATGNPCEVRYKDDDLALSLCGEDWARKARVSPIIRNSLTRESVLRGTMPVGRACAAVVQVPLWWDSAGAVEPGERAMKMSCPVYKNVKAKDLSFLTDMRKWLFGTGGGQRVLKLEDAFNVQTPGGGGSVYREKVHILIDDQGYKAYREEFLRRSWPWTTAGVVLLIVIAGLLYHARRQELQYGSAAWGARCRRGLPLIALLAIVVLAGSLWAVTMG